MKNKVTVLHGDCLAILPTLEANSIDAVVTDPPYHLTTGKKGGTGIASLNPDSPAGRSRISTGFMGRVWDGGDVAFRPETWAEVYRVLKPGGHMFAFGGTRTSHRLTCAIEDAGFEIRDTYLWLYGSGFPKSRNISKDIDKAAGAVREVVGTRKGKGGENLNILARVGGNDAEDAAGCGAYGQGARQIDIDIPVTAPATPEAAQWDGWGTSAKPAWEPIVLCRKPFKGTVAGNVLKHGTGGLNIDACRIGLSEGDDPRLGGKGSWTTTQQPDGDTVTLPRGTVASSELGRWPANVCHDGSPEVMDAFAAYGDKSSPWIGNAKGVGAKGGTMFGGSDQQRSVDKPEYADAGSAARFFYSSKADASDRADSKHPTVKPIDLMRWLCRLITPPGGMILDPFAGSGTTGEASVLEGFRATLIEQDAAHVKDIRRRLGRATGDDTPLFADIR